MVLRLANRFFSFLLNDDDDHDDDDDDDDDDDHGHVADGTNKNGLGLV